MNKKSSKMENIKRIQQFAAIMAVAYEYGVYCKDDLLKIYMESLPPMNRTSRRREEMDYRKSWAKLESLMKRFANINEETNPEWFDTVVDRLTEVIESVEVELKKE